MAKRKGKKGKVEKDLYTFNNSVNAIFEKNKPLTKDKKKALLKETKKQSKKALKKFNKTQKFNEHLEWSKLKNRERMLSGDENRMIIKYGNFEFNVKTDWFTSLKDKEKTLDRLYHFKMKSILSKVETPKNEREANEVESLMNLYAKKVQGRKFYDSGLVKNVVNKLENFKGGLNLWQPNEVTKSIKNTGEVPPDKIYDVVEKPILLDDELLSLEINFF